MTWFLALILLLLPAYLVRFSVFGIPTTVLEVLIYLAAVGVLVSQPLARTGGRLKPFLRWYGWPIGLILVGSLIAAYVAPDKRIALGLLKGYVLDPLLLLFILVSVVDTKQKLAKLVTALALSGLVVGLGAVLGPQNTEGRSLGLYSFDLNPSPNYVALYLSPLVGLTFGLSLFKQNWLPRPLAVLSFALVTFGLIESGSRGGLLAAALAVGLAVLWRLIARSKGKLRQAAIGALALFVVAVLAGAVWQARPDFSASGSHRERTSNNLRYEIWRTTLVDIIPDKPLTGVGLGNFQAYFTERTKNRVNFPEFIAPWARTPHNLFLTLWTNLGLLSLVGFLWAIILFFVDLARLPGGQAGKKPVSSLGVALALAMIGLLAHGLVDAAYWKNDLAALFWTLIGLGYLASRLSSGQARLPDRQGKEDHA